MTGRATARPTLLVALTGGIASGKSTVGRLLREAGLQVWDADALVAELYQPGAAGSLAVEERFGTGMLDETGAVDRPRLGEHVFSDPQARRDLEAIIHPLVGRAFAERLAGSEGIVVYEVPLLVETGGRRHYEAVVTVEADEAERLDRAVERGLSRAEAERRMAAQASREERVALADFVIDNSGSLAQLEAQVSRVIEALRERLAAKSAQDHPGS